MSDLDILDLPRHELVLETCGAAVAAI